MLEGAVLLRKKLCGALNYIIVHFGAAMSGKKVPSRRDSVRRNNRLYWGSAMLHPSLYSVVPMGLSMSDGVDVSPLRTN